MLASPTAHFSTEASRRFGKPRFLLLVYGQKQTRHHRLAIFDREASRMATEAMGAEKIVLAGG